MTSVLSEESFTETHGSGWVLADGREVPGTKYARLVGPRVPDLRGLFLRGINVGRADAFADPDGERTPGSTQGDTTALPKDSFKTDTQGQHNHGNKNVGNGAGRHLTGRHEGPAFGAPKIPPDGSHRHEVVGGDSETRSKNAAVFYYIRVG